ncbi:hypothetical protein SAMN04488503_2989 [Humidesulfovibrio mexicanus]|uniref:Uncharacterized protein n=1 Tax=Humidesulfovibrio mexicanus TaxID=147047 RepID=A0A239C7R2_9BACT|nr:hypothetical protein [Humidesulfovibrio mexicanus]SNS15979.1 hypothetical protein SAMN04488503_2989 [Humidesulfovibrio mexicanus]
MSTTQPLYDLLKKIDALVVQALRHPEASQSDRAIIVQGGTRLAEVCRRHMPKRLPIDAAALPAGAHFQSFTPVPGLKRGHLLDWEDSKEGAHEQ